MLIIKIPKNGGIERAIKELRSKVRNTKQVEKLRKRQEFVKPSVINRLTKKKAQYIQKLKDNQEK